MDNNFWTCPECGNTYKSDIKECPNCENNTDLIDEEDSISENDNSTIFQEISKSNTEDNINSDKNNYTNSSQNVDSNASSNNYYQSNNYNNPNTGYHNYNQSNNYSQPIDQNNQNLMKCPNCGEVYIREMMNCPSCHAKNPSPIKSDIISCPRCGRHDYEAIEARGGFFSFFRTVEANIMILFFIGVLILEALGVPIFDVIHNNLPLALILIVVTLVIAIVRYPKSKEAIKYKCKHCGFVLNEIYK